MEKIKTIEIINEGFFLIANGNFSEKEEKEIKKISNLENILEFLQSCKILNIIFHNHNSEIEKQIFIEMFNKFLNLKNFKEIEKIEIFKIGNNSLTIHPKEKSFKIYYRGGTNNFSFDNIEENINISYSNLNIIEEEIKEYKKVKEIFEKNLKYQEKSS